MALWFSIFPAGKGKMKTRVILRTLRFISSPYHNSFDKNSKCTTLKEGDCNSTNTFLLKKTILGLWALGGAYWKLDTKFNFICASQKKERT